MLDRPRGCDLSVVTERQVAALMLPLREWAVCVWFDSKAQTPLIRYVVGVLYMT